MVRTTDDTLDPSSWTFFQICLGFKCFFFINYLSVTVSSLKQFSSGPPVFEFPCLRPQRSTDKNPADCVFFLRPDTEYSRWLGLTQPVLLQWEGIMEPRQGAGAVTGLVAAAGRVLICLFKMRWREREKKTLKAEMNDNEKQIHRPSLLPFNNINS